MKEIMYNPYGQDFGDPGYDPGDEEIIADYTDEVL